MLTINDHFPDFNLKVVTEGEIQTLTSDDLKENWSIIFFYPEDFSFICPTEVTEFESYRELLESENTRLLGISTDDIDTHVKWADKLDVNYPLGSDLEGELARKVGVLDEADQRAHRATFIVDPEFTIQFSMITSRNVGRSVEETIRVYKAILTGKKCPAEYRANEE